MGFKQKTCEHLEELTDIKKALAYECKECVKKDGTWVHLRTCQDCGATLCCDSSPNKHARKHARRDNHNIIASAEPGEKWLYCYKDDLTKTY